MKCGPGCECTSAPKKKTKTKSALQKHAVCCADHVHAVLTTCMLCMLSMLCMLCMLCSDHVHAVCLRPSCASHGGGGGGELYGGGGGDANSVHDPYTSDTDSESENDGTFVAEWYVSTLAQNRFARPPFCVVPQLLPI